MGMGMWDLPCGMRDAQPSSRRCPCGGRVPEAAPRTRAAQSDRDQPVPPSLSHTFPAAHLLLLTPSPLPDPPRGSALCRAPEIAVK